MSEDKLVDIAVAVEHVTEKAWLLTDGVTSEWVPKSQAEDNRDGTFTMPEWLAKKKGFM
jgi:hypothetical protein